jgi:hypothetical protein
VNGLYTSLYREVVARLPEPRWRERRTGEALAVNRTLVSLLELGSR